jgi:hypothetical protein
VLSLMKISYPSATRPVSRRPAFAKSQDSKTKS